MTDQVYFEDVQAGSELPTLRKDPTTQQLVMYAGASGDFYQIHYDQEYARAIGLPNVILHGALKNAFLGQIVTDWMGELGTLRKLAVQYRGMDVPGSPVFCKGVVAKTSIEGGEGLAHCDIWLENAQGRKTTPGNAVVSLPLRSG